MVQLKKEVDMKSLIFSNAIHNRNRIRFYYGLREILVDPYFITVERNGKKVIYGKTPESKEIKKFEYEKIANIKILDNIKFSPIIPIIPLVN